MAFLLESRYPNDGGVRSAGLLVNETKRLDIRMNVVGTEEPTPGNSRSRLVRPARFSDCSTRAVRSTSGVEIVVREGGVGRLFICGC